MLINMLIIMMMKTTTMMKIVGSNKVAFTGSFDDVIDDVETVKVRVPAAHQLHPVLWVSVV